MVQGIDWAAVAAVAVWPVLAGVALIAAWIGGEGWARHEAAPAVAGADGRLIREGDAVRAVDGALRGHVRDIDGEWVTVWDGRLRPVRVRAAGLAGDERL